MKYLSVCSGIEAVTVAWESLGHEPVGLSEIDRHACRVLECRHPNIFNYGDLKKFRQWAVQDFDCLVGGTPCQAFSTAGNRGGIKDERGHLSVVYVEMLEHFRPEYFVWENVPGVLSSNKGRDFGSFLYSLVKLGYSVAYRVLDAQYFGVPQQRRRVFVAGSLGGREACRKILFPTEDTKTVKELSIRPRTDVVMIDTMNHIGRKKPRKVRLDRHISYTITRNHSHGLYDGKLFRRFTPVEVERLMGFPDGYTDVGLTDNQRYRCLGNSMVTNVIRWIGRNMV